MEKIGPNAKELLTSQFTYDISDAASGWAGWTGWALAGILELS